MALGVGLANPATGPAPTTRAVPVVPVVHAVGTRLVLAGRPFHVFGFNYQFGAAQPNVDYLESPTPAGLQRMRGDFAEAARLGANTVRFYAPISAIMESATAARPAALAALRQTLAAAWQAGLRVDLTGDITWDPERLPAWYTEFPEAGRWEVDENFWRAVAAVGAKADNVFAYELTSEPAIVDSSTWYGTGFPSDTEPGHYHYLRVIVCDLAGRDPAVLAWEWTRRMRDAVRSVDSRHMITLGLLPARGTPFDSAEILDLLDLVTVHVYPLPGTYEHSAQLVEYFARQGRPLLLGETFALSRRGEERFLVAMRNRLDGTLSFYDGRAPEDVTGASDVDQIYRRNLISYLGLRPTLRGSPPASWVAGR